MALDVCLNCASELYLEHLLTKFQQTLYRSLYIWKEWFGIEDGYISLNQCRVIALELC